MAVNDVAEEWMYHVGLRYSSWISES